MGGFWCQEWDVDLRPPTATRRTRAKRVRAREVITHHKIVPHGSWNPPFRDEDPRQTHRRAVLVWGVERRGARARPRRRERASTMAPKEVVRLVSGRRRSRVFWTAYVDLCESFELSIVPESDADTYRGTRGENESRNRGTVRWGESAGALAVAAREARFFVRGCRGARTRCASPTPNGWWRFVFRSRLGTRYVSSIRLGRSRVQTHSSTCPVTFSRTLSIVTRASYTQSHPLSNISRGIAHREPCCRTSRVALLAAAGAARAVGAGTRLPRLGRAPRPATRALGPARE